MSHINRRTLFLAGAAGLAALAGCGSRPQVPALPRAPLTRVRVLPVTSPDRFYTYNNWVGGLLWSSIANRVKTNLFDEKMEVQRKAMGPKMTAALITALRAAGCDADIIPVPARYRDADYVDVTKLPTTDPVLYAQFGETGMDSARFSSFYLPRLSIGATLSSVPAGDTLASSYPRYGADAKANAEGSIEAEARFRFPDFDALMNRTSDVIDSFDAGIQKLAQHVVRDIRNQY